MSAEDFVLQSITAGIFATVVLDLWQRLLFAALQVHKQARGNEQADDISDRAQVNHGTEPWPGARPKSIGNRATGRDRFAVRSEERIALRST